LIRRNRALVAALPMLLCASTALVAAEGPDELWEMEMKMEMAGAPVPMPGQSQRMCRPKGKGRDAAMPADDKCKLVESKQAGSRHMFKMLCQDGKDKYTVTGETEGGADSYRGKLRTVGTMDGEAVDMTQTFSGRKVGNCAYEDPANKQQEMMAQHNATMAKECRKSIDELQPTLFTMENSPCADFKPEFCARVGKVASQMRDPAGFRSYAGKDWQGSLQACGQDPLAVRRDACNAANGKRDWSFVSDHCEDTAKALARQHCEGRSYTAAMSSEYAPICARYAANQGGRSYTATPTAATTEQKSGAKETLKKGSEKLKKFLKF
jgi:hypothetical protein